MDRHIRTAAYFISKRQKIVRIQLAIYTYYVHSAALNGSWCGGQRQLGGDSGSGTLAAFSGAQWSAGWR